MSVGPDALLVLANMAAVVFGVIAAAVAALLNIRFKPYDKALLATTVVFLAVPLAVAAFTLPAMNLLTVIGVVLHAFGVPYAVALVLNFAVFRPDKPLVLHAPVFLGWLLTSAVVLAVLVATPSPPEFELGFVVLAAPVVIGVLSGGAGYGLYRLRDARFDG